MTKAIEKADRILAGTKRAIRLFSHLHPVNADFWKRAYLTGGARPEPAFEYGPVGFSADELTRGLDALPLDEFPDSKLAGLYSGTARFLKETISMLEARGSGEFRQISRELFGEPSGKLAAECSRFLLGAPEDAKEPLIGPKAAAERLKRYIAEYAKKYPGFSGRVEFRKEMSATMQVDEDTVVVNDSATFSTQIVECDIHHECDAHLLSFLNAARQPLGLWRTGTAGALRFQESLGVFCEFAAGVLVPARLKRLCARVVAVDMMLGGASFSDTFNHLVQRARFAPADAFDMALRVFRGGGFTKDWLYLADVERMLTEAVVSDRFRAFFSAKLDFSVIDELDEYEKKGWIAPSTFLPLWAGQAEDRLARVARMLEKGTPLTDVLCKSKEARR